MTTDPSLMIKQAVKFFLSHWYLGLQPSLVINTGYYGDIFLSSEVKSCKQPYQPFLFRRRRSGQQSRQRRSNKRSRARDIELERGLEPHQLNEVLSMPTIGMDSYPDATVSDLDNAKFTPALKVANLDTAVQAVPEFIDVSCQSEPCKPQPKPQSLTFVKNEAISIPPRKIFHPTIINASKSRHGKHPSELSKEEIVQFNAYLKWKHDIGEPVQKDLIYLPSMMRDCLHCGNPT